MPVQMLISDSNNREGGILCSFLHSLCFRRMFLQQQLTQDIIDLDYISVKEMAYTNLRKLHTEVQLFHEDKQEKVWERQWNKKYVQTLLFPRNLAKMTIFYSFKTITMVLFASEWRRVSSDFIYLFWKGKKAFPSTTLNSWWKIQTPK